MTTVEEHETNLDDGVLMTFELGVMDSAAVRLLPDTLIAKRLAAALRKQADALDSDPQQVHELVKVTVRSTAESISAMEDGNVIGVADCGTNSQPDKSGTYRNSVWVRLHDGSTRVLMSISEDEASSKGLPTSLAGAANKE